MKAARYTIHLISVLLLVLWGAVMLYFYTSGRIIQYLPPDGIFRPLVLWSGLGMMVLGLFNLFTMRAKEADCGHDHGEGGCCGHDHEHHSDKHEHEHQHEDGEACCSHHHGHGHGHEEHKHEHGCCGHDHAHGHAGHSHDDEAGHSHGHDHAHGILNESGLAGKVFAIFMLAVPVTYAAIKSPDRFSEFAVMNKGVYDQNYGSTARADEFSLKRPAAARQQTTQQSQLPAGDAAPGLTPAVSATKDPQGGIMVPTPSADKIPGAEGQDVKSYGSFTLQDLEQQIPKSPDGNFLLEVPEIYYTASDKEVQSVLTGQPIETIAQILPEKGELNADGRRARIFRMMVQCCAADARPYSIPVQFEQTPPAFKNMGWVKITGIVDYEMQEGQTIPVIRARTLTEAAQPDDQKVY